MKASGRNYFTHKKIKEINELREENLDTLPTRFYRDLN